MCFLLTLLANKFGLTLTTFPLSQVTLTLVVQPNMTKKKGQLISTRAVQLCSVTKTAS